ncbi:MAG: class I SAM-dependent methyltransferase [Armatimonadetes bacterium]|nr:class I SAM-dependent methyltransferase [Armatimonadota bacterium]
MSDCKNVWGTTEKAREYERESVPGRLALWPGKLLPFAKLCSSDRVLDVGCGTGVLTIAAHLVSETVIGLDINESMLAVAASKEPLIDWRIGDACDLPFDDESFDVVVSQFALMFVDDAAQALSEIWRVLAPGGRLVVAVWATGKDNPVHETLANLVREHYGDEAAARYSTPYAMGDATALQELAQSAGITRPKIRLLRSMVTSASLTQLVEGNVKKWVSDDPADDEKLAAMHSQARELLSDYEQASGEMKYPMKAMVVIATR